MYNIRTQHFCTLQIDHRKSSNELSSYSYSDIIDYIPYTVHYIFMTY